MKRLPYEPHKLETPGSTPVFRSQRKHIKLSFGPMPKNNPPKNFKNMAFPPSRFGTPSSFASPIPKTVKQPDPFKDYLNTLRCPVCKSQIDGVATPFYCVADRKHYMAYINGDLPYAPYREIVNLYDGDRRFEIDQYGRTLITVWDAFPKEPFNFDFLVFDFSKTNREKMLHKLKTILVFQ